MTNDPREAQFVRQPLSDFVEVPELFRELWHRYGEDTVFTVVALCQAGTVLITWELWSAREGIPPALPRLEFLPSLPMAWPLLASLAVTSVARRWGVALHLVLLAYAVMIDQTRLQPEFLSMALLLAALAFRSMRVLGRAHLATLWWWAGFNKLLSSGFATGGAASIAGALGAPVGAVRWIVPLSEIALGLLALSWRSRHVVVIGAFAVHGTILLTLLIQSGNSAVWLWNLALPFAAALLLTSDRDDRIRPLLSRHPVRRRSIGVSLTVWVFAWAYPAGFYLGITDAYLAHNLYSSNTNTATVCSDPAQSSGGADQECVDPFRSTWEALNVPFPPEVRLYRQWFDGTCEVGDVLRVRSIQTKLTRPSVQDFECHLEEK